MEDWVRAVNGCRRKLSEQEEDDRNKREGRSASGMGTGMGMSMPIPSRQTQGGQEGLGVDTHQGTYSSVFTNSTSISSSPVATTGYFAPKIASQPQQSQSYSMAGSHSGTPQHQYPHPSAAPTSPMDTTNYLTAQMARVSIPQRTPSTSNPQSRSVSSRREPSASSMSSSIGRNPSGGDYQPRSAQLPPPLSSDEDEPYFSDPNMGLGTSMGATPTMMSASSSTAPGTNMGTGNLVIDPKRIILSAYLMKRSRARGRKVWKKRWFFLTSQGLTYTKSHMVSLAIVSCA